MLIFTVQGDLSKILKLINEKILKKRISFKKKISAWWNQINKWRSRNCLKYKNSKKIIKPQYALQRLE